MQPEWSNIMQLFQNMLGVQPRNVQASQVTLQLRYVGAHIETQNPPQLQVGYDHFFWVVRGFVQWRADPDTDLDNWSRVQYNVYANGDGWNTNIWDVPNNLQPIVSRDGGGRPVSMLPMFLHFANLTTLKLILEPNPADPTWVGEASTIGVQLIGCKIRKDLDRVG